MKSITRARFRSVTFKFQIRFLSHICLLGLVIFLIVDDIFAQTKYNDKRLEGKHMQTESEISALMQPFIGVTTSGQKFPDLFLIRSTGLSTASIQEAAVRFLDELTPIQQTRTLFSINDHEWRRWSNVPQSIYVRQGITLKEMTKTQHDAAMSMMAVSLSPKGMRLSRDIMKTDHTLQEITGNDLNFDEQHYSITMMGLPSNSEPWGWQIDGHHLVINYFVLGDQVVMSPVFLGGEPVVTTTGKYAGNAVLQEEQDKGLTLMQSLNESQKAAAQIESRKLWNGIKAGANNDNLVLDYAGIPAVKFTEEQKNQLLELIALFVGNMRKDQAQVRMDEVDAHLDVMGHSKCTS